MVPVAPNARMRSGARTPGATRWKNAIRNMKAGTPQITHRPRAPLTRALPVPPALAAGVHPGCPTRRTDRRRETATARHRMGESGATAAER